MDLCKKSPFVLVSPPSSDPDIPDKRMTRSALGDLSYHVSYLLCDGNSFITKLSGGNPHGNAVFGVCGEIGFYSRQYREFRCWQGSTDSNHCIVDQGQRYVYAPDAVLNRNYPQIDRGPPPLRTPFVVEVEVAHRGPKALKALLDLYLTQPGTKYVLGIKFFVNLPRRELKAVAILWRKSDQEGGIHPVQGVWNFGELPLHARSIAAFCQPLGRLEPPTPEAFLPNPSVAGANRIVTICNADMIEGLTYPDPNNPRTLIPVPLTGGDFTLDLNEIYESCKQGVMPMEPMRTRSQT